MDDIKTLSKFNLPISEGNFPIIFDSIERIIPFSKSISSFIFALIIYLVGLLYSFIFGFSHLYLHTYLFFHVALAIFLALSIITISKKEIMDFFILVRPCFSVDDKNYIKLITHWMKTIFKIKGFWITWSILAIAILWGITSIFFPYPFIKTILSWLSQVSFREILSPEWFIGNHIAKLILIIVMLLLGSLPLALGIWATIVFVPLINQFISMPVIPIPGALLTLLRKPTELFLRVSFYWFLLTGSTGITLFKSVDLYATLLILLISSGGIIAFFIPQFAFHNLIVKSYYKFTQMVIAEYNVKNKENIGVKGQIALTDYIRDVFDKVKPTNLWVFDINDILLLIIGQAVSLIGSLQQIIH